MGTWTPDPSGAVLVHASAVNLDGGALMFLGPNHTGKSTVRKLFSGVAEPIADDMTILLPQRNREWLAMGGDACSSDRPWTRSDIAVDGAVPLREVFRLRQASQPVLVSLRKPATCYHLTNAFFELLWQHSCDAGTRRTIFARLAAIARSETVRGYELYFDRSIDTVELVLKEIAIQRSIGSREGGELYERQIDARQDQVS